MLLQEHTGTIVRKGRKRVERKKYGYHGGRGLEEGEAAGAAVEGESVGGLAHEGVVALRHWLPQPPQQHYLLRRRLH
jgi:hypothetical protein